MKVIEKLVMWFCRNCQTPQSKNVKLDAMIEGVQEEIFTCRKCNHEQFMKVNSDGTATYAQGVKENTKQ